MLSQLTPLNNYSLYLFFTSYDDPQIYLFSSSLQQKERLPIGQQYMKYGLICIYFKRQEVHMHKNELKRQIQQLKCEKIGFYLEQQSEKMFWPLELEKNRISQNFELIRYNIYVSIMSKENKSWNQYEDEILKELRQVRGIKKWSIIAEKMAEQFKIPGKSGKRCRQRYQHHLSQKVKHDQWTHQEQKTLFQLHNEKGNRWVEIAKTLGRSDNSVKNHYHSKLRKALRKINCLISQNLKGQFKPLKNNIISKVLQTAEASYSKTNKQEEDTSTLCFNIKNKILKYLHFEEPLTTQHLIQLKSMVKDINQFNKTFKRKTKAKQENSKEYPTYHGGKYKGKEILSLIMENRINSIKEESMQSQEISSEESAHDKSSEPIVKGSPQTYPHQAPIKTQQNPFPEHYQSYVHQMPAYPTYPFSYFGNPCAPNMFQMLSYNFLLNQRASIQCPTFQQSSHDQTATKHRENLVLQEKNLEKNNGGFTRIQIERRAEESQKKKQES